MTKKEIPELVQLFTNLLWVNSPKNWIIKSTYFQNTLFVSMLIGTHKEGHYQKIRRSFDVEIINLRSEDIWGMAEDVVQEMKSEIND